MKISRKIVSNSCLRRPEARRGLFGGEKALEFSPLRGGSAFPSELGARIPLSREMDTSYGSPLPTTAAGLGALSPATGSPLTMGHLGGSDDWLGGSPEDGSPMSCDGGADWSDASEAPVRGRANPRYRGMTDAQIRDFEASEAERKKLEWAAVMAKYASETGGDGMALDECPGTPGAPGLSDSLIMAGKESQRFFSRALETAIDTLNYRTAKTPEVMSRLSMLGQSTLFYRNWKVCPIGTMNVVSPEGPHNVRKHFLPEFIVSRRFDTLQSMRDVEARLHTDTKRRGIPIVEAHFNEADLSVRLERLDHTKIISPEEMQYHCFDFLMKEVQSYRTHGFFVVDDKEQLLFKLDIGPGNIMKDSEGNVKLVDWALSPDNTNKAEGFLIEFFSQVQNHVREDQRVVVIGELLSVLKDNLAIVAANAFLTKICLAVCDRVVDKYAGSRLLVESAKNMEIALRA